METKPSSKLPKPKNRAEEVALKLWTMAMVEETSDKQQLARIVQLIDRVDGRTAAAPEDREALVNSAPKIMLLDPRLRPGGDGDEE
jgi:MoxR-like ATPase